MAFRVNLPPLTRALMAALIALSVTNALLRRTSLIGTYNINPVPQLTLVPRANSIRFPWTFITASFVEQNIVSFLISGATLFYGGRYLERAWSSAELAKFVLFVVLIPNLITYFIYSTWLVTTGRSSWTSVDGAVALEAAFMVAFKQLVPEHTVAIAKGMIRMRVKHFPAIFLLANTLSGPIFGTDTAVFLSWFGFMTSWIYLRFYQRTPALSTTSTGDGPIIRGDASDTFAFAQFFPEPINTPIATAADTIYKALVALKICTPFSAEDVDTGNEQAAARGEGGLPSLLNAGGRGARPGGKREEAERRRALALKALDQRLHTAATRAQPASAAGPSMLGQTDFRPDAPDEIRSNQEEQA